MSGVPFLVEVHTPNGNIVQITGVKNPGKAVSILLRGSNKLVRWALCAATIFFALFFAPVKDQDCNTAAATHAPVWLAGES